MDAVTDRTIRAGRATPEADWLACAALRDAPAIDAAELVPATARAVVVSPHPDDEVIATGGLLSLLARAGRPLCLVAVTDGTASHPGSARWPARRLQRHRPREQALALQRLGADAAAVHRLGLPDGGLQAAQPRLAGYLLQLLRPGDVVFATWRLDGHPDHEAVGRACADAAAQRGARLVEVPVWGWHWSRPQDAPMPWRQARRVDLDAQTVRRKCAALRMHRSQLRPDPSTGAPPILDGATLARAARPFELVFVHDAP